MRYEQEREHDERRAAWAREVTEAEAELRRVQLRRLAVEREVERLVLVELLSAQEAYERGEK